MSTPQFEFVVTRAADSVGPWSEEEFLALPGSNQRLELLDGALLVSPSPASWHQRLSTRLCFALETMRPDHLEVLPAVDVRLGSGQILVPDVVLVHACSENRQLWDAAEVCLAVEIVSPGSVAMDRAVKPRLYAEAGIATFVRIELTGPSAVVGTLSGDRYQLSEPSPILRLTEPFEVEIDLPALLAAPRARAGGAWPVGPANPAL